MIPPRKTCVWIIAESRKVRMEEIKWNFGCPHPASAIRGAFQVHGTLSLPWSRGRNFFSLSHSRRVIIPQFSRTPSQRDNLHTHPICLLRLAGSELKRAEIAWIIYVMHLLRKKFYVLLIFIAFRSDWYWISNYKALRRRRSSQPAQSVSRTRSCENESSRVGRDFFFALVANKFAFSERFYEFLWVFRVKPIKIHSHARYLITWFRRKMDEL